MINNTNVAFTHVKYSTLLCTILNLKARSTIYGVTLLAKIIFLDGIYYLIMHILSALKKETGVGVYGVTQNNTGNGNSHVDAETSASKDVMYFTMI